MWFDRIIKSINYDITELFVQFFFVFFMPLPAFSANSLFPHKHWSLLLLEKSCFGLQPEVFLFNYLMHLFRYHMMEALLDMLSFILYRF